MKQPLYKKIYAELHEAIVEGRLAPAVVSLLKKNYLNNTKSVGSPLKEP